MKVEEWLGKENQLGLLSYCNIHYFLLNTFALDCVAKLLPKLNFFVWNGCK